MVNSLRQTRLEDELASSRRKPRACAALLMLLFATAATVAVAVIGHNFAKKPHGVLAKLDNSSLVIDLRSAKYCVKPSMAKVERRERFASMMNRLKPYAAITGTFYSPDLKPLGDIVADGKLINRGFERQAIGFNRDGQICFLERRGRAKLDWKGCYAGVACGPRLIRNGKIDINVRRDGFSSNAATITATRCAVGKTIDGKLIMLAINEYVTLHTLAQAMSELGAIDAVNMDGGALCAFYCNGKCAVEPVMPINNVIAVYRMK